MNLSGFFGFMGVYTKGGNWLIFKPPPTASWTFRKLCRFREKLINWMNIEAYNIKDVYRDIIGSHPTVNWSKFVWHKTSILKTTFVFWLAMLKKLKTRDHLELIGVLEEDSCPFCCIVVESVAHLFFECRYSRDCITQFSSWLGISIRSLFINPSNCKVPNLMRKIVVSSICSLIYHLWRSRNDCIWCFKVVSPVMVVKNVMLETKLRVLSCILVS